MPINSEKVALQNINSNPELTVLQWENPPAPSTIKQSFIITIAVKLTHHFAYTHCINNLGLASYEAMEAFVEYIPL